LARGKGRTRWSEDDLPPGGSHLMDYRASPIEPVLAAAPVHPRLRMTADRKTVALATQLRSEGQTEFLNVLDAHRSLCAAKDALIQSGRGVSADIVALYEALGGGWDASWRASDGGPNAAAAQ